ncbi:hypothetical protein QL285_045745 [Trifolium repens]|nr:hypothetical protein QL285_045745 [Trifolium repens]
MEDSGLWKEVLAAKYGAHVLHNVVWNGPIPSFASQWWKDIRDLDVCVEAKNWLEESCSRCLGNGARTSFWNDKWVGDLPLSVSFPRLFSLANDKEVTIGELVVVDGDRIGWNFSWRRRLFHWEEESVSLLLAQIDHIRISNVEDRWRWNLDSEGVFSVHSAFVSLSKELVPGRNLSPFETSIFKSIWDSPAPSKVIAFSWQLLYDRVPTKVNLASRGILPPNSGEDCIWCRIGRESSSHLFLNCKMIMAVWYEIFKWLGVVVVVPPNLFHLFDCLSVAAKNKKIRKGFRLIWHTVFWSIWRVRNNFIFNNVRTEPLELVEEIKVVSWKWSTDRLKITPCLFYEWSWDPGICFES